MNAAFKIWQMITQPHETVTNTPTPIYIIYSLTINRLAAQHKGTASLKNAQSYHTQTLTHTTHKSAARPDITPKASINLFTLLIIAANQMWRRLRGAHAPQHDARRSSSLRPGPKRHASVFLWAGGPQILTSCIKYRDTCGSMDTYTIYTRTICSL